MTTTIASIAVKPGHVGLNVTDLQRSRDFYVQALDLETLGASSDTDRESVYLGRNGVVLLTLWRQAEDAFAATRSGLHHLALQVDTVGELEALQTRLIALGVERRYRGVVLHAEGADSGGIYFSDPDGIRLEVFTAAGLAGTGAVAPGPSLTCGHF